MNIIEYLLIVIFFMAALPVIGMIVARFIEMFGY
jgi:hypothetical protein